MPGLAYPFVFECSNCGNETKVTRSNALDLHPDPDDRGALDTVLQYRGWMKAPMDNALYCPDCVEGATEDAE